jgi:hypothetical protein
MSTEDSTATTFARMHLLLATSAIELFGAYGVPLVDLPPGARDRGRAGVRPGPFKPEILVATAKKLTGTG